MQIKGTIHMLSRESSISSLNLNILSSNNSKLKWGSMEGLLHFPNRVVPFKMIKKCFLVSQWASRSGKHWAIISSIWIKNNSMVSCRSCRITAHLRKKCLSLIWRSSRIGSAENWNCTWTSASGRIKKRRIREPHPPRILIRPNNRM